jgi:uncharacterized protein YndB with AHSA1/START domain
MDGQARAVADVEQGEILASVEIPVPPEQVFPALTSAEITHWWVRPGVFDTREWSGDVRPGGRWQASGLVRGRPYGLQGEFVDITAPAALVHTYQRTDVPDTATTVRYTLASSSSGGTRITLRHTGFLSADACQNNAAGWESSLAQLRRTFEQAASPA